MSYPKQPDFRKLTSDIAEYARLGHEYGAPGVQELLDEAEAALVSVKRRLMLLEGDPALASNEPDDYGRILELRPCGPRRIWENFNLAEYDRRLRGAILGRFAGCVLGAPVEFWSVEKMERWAAHIGDTFPPVDYWSRIKDECAVRYGKSQCIDYTRSAMDGIPVDDDIAYTQLGLLIAEEYGLNFTTADVGRAWLKYLPYACTAEEVALAALNAGTSADRAAESDNPYAQWIGADIRSDPWGYLAPGLPEVAARMAYRDARLSHRRNGVYGEMFFSAAIAAAFEVDDPIEAVKIGLTEIPTGCSLAGAVRWALDERKNIRDYKAARAAYRNRAYILHNFPYANLYKS